jgi:hypothetical protein
MSMDETTLTCPYCGARYQAKDTTCPRCGKALSPTGYTQYGEPELIASELPTSDMTVAEQADAMPPSSNRNQRTNGPQAVILWGIVLIAALMFIFSRSFHVSLFASATPTPMLSSIFPIGDYPTPSLPDLSPAPIPLYTPDPNGANVKVNHVRVLNTTAGTLIANIYNLGAASAITATAIEPALFPPAGVFGPGAIDVVAGAVVIDGYNAADQPLEATIFTHDELPYRRGSALLPIVDGELYGDSLVILTSAGITETEHYPSASFVVAGQLIAGFDVLDRLNSSDKVISDQTGR